MNKSRALSRNQYARLCELIPFVSNYRNYMSLSLQDRILLDEKAGINAHSYRPTDGLIGKHDEVYEKRSVSFVRNYDELIDDTDLGDLYDSGDL